MDVLTYSQKGPNNNQFKKRLARVNCQLLLLLVVINDTRAHDYIYISVIPP